MHLLATYCTIHCFLFCIDLDLDLNSSCNQVDALGHTPMPFTSGGITAISMFSDIKQII